jgi:CRP-like cAMP-binding protein
MRLETAAEILDRAEFFDILTHEDKRLLAFAAEWRRVTADAVVCEGTEAPLGAHVLINGTLRATPVGEITGRPYTISQPGTVISTMALILAKPRMITVTAMVDSELLFVPRTAFRRLMEQSPDIAERAVEHIQRDLTRYMNALEPLRQKMKRS